MTEKKVADLLQNEQGEGWLERYVVANAPALMALFANFVVIVADIRAYDVVFTLTGSWWKALSASLACAVPFVLWEVAWQYNHTTEGWRRASLAMAGVAFATSLFLGVADFLQFTGEWTNILLGGVVIMTGLHTVMGFLYYYNDPDVARRRHKAQALAMMADREVNAQLAGQLLQSGNDLLRIISALESKYDPEDVESVLNILDGKRKNKPSVQRSRPQQQQQQPRPAMAQEVRQERLQDENPTPANRSNGNK